MNEIVTMSQAADELNIDLEEFVDLLVQDGMIVDLDGELVALPHPDLMPL